MKNKLFIYMSSLFCILLTNINAAEPINGKAKLDYGGNDIFIITGTPTPRQVYTIIIEVSPKSSVEWKIKGPVGYRLNGIGSTVWARKPDINFVPSTVTQPGELFGEVKFEQYQGVEMGPDYILKTANSQKFAKPI